MDYIKGGNLQNYLNKNMLDFEDKLYQLYTISYGLDSIHEKDLVHKDFHPGNILVNDMECYIIDLGLSKPVSEVKKEGIYGILPYMAPEVLRGYQYTKAA